MRNEVQYISSALFAHKVDLPENYWRFTLLRPFIDVDAKTSPLMRNFCPLFWVTNLLAALYVILSPVILITFPVIKVGDYVIKGIGSLRKKFAENAKQKEETEEEEKKEAIPFDFKFTSKNVYSLFGLPGQMISAQVFYNLYLSGHDHWLRCCDSDFKLEQITDKEVEKLRDTFDLEKDDLLAWVFVYQFKTEWRNKFEEFTEEPRNKQKAKELKVKERKAAREARLKKALPKLVAVSKGFLFGLGVCAVVLGVTALCWGVYLWFMPAVHGIAQAFIAVFNFFTSVNFLTAVFHFFLLCLAFGLLMLFINTPLLMFQDKITELCEDYYVNKLPVITFESSFHGAGKNCIKSGKFRSAFFLLFICRMLDVIATIIETILGFVFWPIMFIKMFYAENCPSINVISNDTDTGTKPENTESKDS